MPKGTPFAMKCPKCHRGQWRRPRPDKGVRKTGKVERACTRSKHSGHGGGGPSFRGHRGQVECLDCKHVWFSTHPDSGRQRCSGKECSHVDSFAVTAKDKRQLKLALDSFSRGYEWED